MEYKTIKDSKGNVLKIANNENEFINSLFNPDGTCSGYIQKVNKHKIDLWILNKEYTINKFGVLCLRTKLDNGKTWYSYQLDFDYMSQHEFIDSLSINKDYSSSECIYYFK